MLNPTGKPLPNCHHLRFLPLPNIAQYWAIETGTDPGDNLRELAFAVHCWLLCENEFRSAYRKSGDPKFLEAVLPNNKEKLEQIGEALKRLYLDNVSLDAPMGQTLAAIIIYAKDMKDWCQRNHRLLPQFWFSPSEAAANPKSGSYQPSAEKLTAEVEKVDSNLSEVLKASEKIPVAPPREQSWAIASTINQDNPKNKKSYLNIELVRRTYDHLRKTQKDTHFTPKEELAFVIKHLAHFDTDKIIELDNRFGSVAEQLREVNHFEWRTKAGSISRMSLKSIRESLRKYKRELNIIN